MKKIKKKKRHFISPKDAPAHLACYLKDPSTLPAIDREEFFFVAMAAFAAAAGQTPMPNPSDIAFDIELEPGQVERLRFTDHPITRSIFAIRDHYGSREEEYHTTVTRYWALCEILASSQCQKWFQPTSDTEGSLNHAVILAAAEEPLNADGHFTESPFFSAVERIAREL
jgi:hypothetical protein